MSQSGILPPPELDVRKPRDDKWEREHRAFLRMLPDLLQTHRDRYVAIHNEQVVEVGDNVVEVAGRAYSTHGYVPIFVDRVTDESPKPLRIPSPRVIGN